MATSSTIMTIIQFASPALRAIFGVIGIMFAVTSASFIGINKIAKVQAETIEKRMMAIRNTDYQHVDNRFDRIDKKLDKILKLVKE